MAEKLLGPSYSRALLSGHLFTIVMMSYANIFKISTCAYSVLWLSGPTGPGSTSLHHQGGGLGQPVLRQGHRWRMSRLTHIPFSVFYQWPRVEVLSNYETSSLCVPLPLLL